MGNFVIFVIALIALTVKINTQKASFKITTPPTATGYPSSFKWGEVLGVGIAAEGGWSDEKFKHVMGVVAQYLDNDGDGCADDPAVVKMLAKKKATMTMYNTAESAMKYNMKHLPLETYTVFRQDLQEFETNPKCSGTKATEKCRDAALEEVLHLISAKGIDQIYKKKFNPMNSLLTKAMDKARGGKFNKPPKKYPKKAFYTYDDKTCTYNCQSVEYFYWLLTTILGGQEKRKLNNSREWIPSTKAEVKKMDPEGYNLMTHGNKLKVMSENGKIPDGNYSPKLKTGTKCITYNMKREDIVKLIKKSEEDESEEENESEEKHEDEEEHGEEEHEEHEESFLEMSGNPTKLFKKKNHLR